MLFMIVYLFIPQSIQALQKMRKERNFVVDVSLFFFFQELYESRLIVSLTTRPASMKPNMAVMWATVPLT